MFYITKICLTKKQTKTLQQCLSNIMDNSVVINLIC